MKRIHKLIAAGLFLSLVITAEIKAQEKAATPQTPAGEVELLKKKVDEQATQLERMQQNLQRQSQIIEQQQRQLEAMQQKIERSAPPPAQPAIVEKPATIESTRPLEAKAEPKPSPTPAQNVESGFGKIKFDGLLQGWYAAGNGGFHDTFRLRRMELKFSGEVTPEIKWTVMFDPARALSANNTFTTINGTKVLADTNVNPSSGLLQDAFITLDYIRNVHIDIGQYKVPLSLEGLQSSATLETVERTMFIADRARGGSYGDVRDFGVMIRGPIGKRVDYQVGLFNGSGENQDDVDKNDQKAVIGRLVVRPPFIRGLQVGGSGVWSGNGVRPDRPRRDRLGGEVLYVRGPFKFKSEVMSGKDADFHRLGYYTHFGYRIRPKVEAVFRFDAFDPDTRRETSSANVTERDYIGGFNYYINENHLKLQVNYVRKTFHNQITPARNLVLVNLQTAW